MKQDAALMRAIGAEFIGRKLRPLLFLALFILVVLIAGDAWLAQLSWWWLLALIPLLIFSVLLVVVFVASRIFLKALRPTQTKAQTTAVGSFVDKMTGVTEQVQTPVPFIAFRVFWDVFVTRKRSYLQTFISNSASLHTDYAELRSHYKDAA
jgi:hypothetical protein